MTRLLDATLSQLTTAFRTHSTATARTGLEPTTIQLVYVALAELRDRRLLDDLIAAAVGVVDARAATEEAREEIRLAAEAASACDGLHSRSIRCYEFKPPCLNTCEPCQRFLDAIEHRRALSHAQKGAVRTLANTVARLRADGVDLSAYRLQPRKGREDKRRARASWPWLRRRARNDH